MKASITFLKYVSRIFMKWFLTVAFAMSVIISLFNVVELFRRAQNKPNVGISQIALMALYQLPELLNQLMPFIILFATMLLLWHLNKRSELVVARSLGLSIWSILTPVWLSVTAFSLFNIAIFNPLGAEFSSRFEQMEADLLTRRSNLMMVSKSGLWLKQEEDDRYSLVHVSKVTPSGQELADVTVYSFDPENRFVNRLDASLVHIHKQGWLFNRAVLSEFNKAPRAMGDILWKTDLTLNKIQESFAAPESISIWQLPSFIHLMDAAGLSNLEHVQYLYKQLLMPFLFLTMATIAGLCAYHFTRRNGGFHFVGTGIFSGFVVFFLHKVSHSMGLSMTVPVFLSVLIPVLIGILGSLALLLHLEEK